MIAGRVGHYLGHMDYFAKDPGKIAYELLFLLGMVPLSSMFDLLPAYRAKDPGGSQEKEEKNRRLLISPAIERMRDGESFLAYPQEEIKRKEILL